MRYEGKGAMRVLSAPCVAVLRGGRRIPGSSARSASRGGADVHVLDGPEDASAAAEVLGRRTMLWSKLTPFIVAKESSSSASRVWSRMLLIPRAVLEPGADEDREVDHEQHDDDVAQHGVGGESWRDLD